MRFARLTGLGGILLCSCGGPDPGAGEELGTVQEPLTLISDGFETGTLAPRWSASGQVAVTTAAVRTGTYGVRFNGTSTLTLSFDTFGLGEPTISYGRRAAHLDSGERLIVEWRAQGESTWRTLQSMGISSWTTSTFTLSGATDTAVSVRFRFNANLAEERADIDNVTISAEPLPTCTDLVKNGAETDVDCGGGSCAPCNIDQGCGAARDCVSETCASKVCRPAQTNQRVAVLLFDYAGNGLQQTPQVIRDAMFTQSNSIAQFFRDASYGKVNLIGDVFGWYRPSRALFGEGWTNCWPAQDEHIFEEVAASVTLANYDKFLLVVHDVDKAECFAANSTYGPATYQTPQGPITASISRLRGPFYPGGDFSRTTQSSVAHELGHSFGVDWHANSYLCTASPLTQTLSACTIGSYGDVFDMMGLRSQAGHFNTAIKQGLGWLPASNVRTVTQSGTFTVLRQEVQQTGTQLLRIPLRAPVQMHTDDESNSAYMQELLVEYRGMTGFDQRGRSIPLQSGGSYTISSTQGALVRGQVCKGGLCPSYLLDMHPQAYVPAYAPNEAADAYLYPNETFVVPGNSMSIQTLSADANSVTVRVDITNLCGNGVVDPGERCDAGSGNSTNLGACRPDCQGRVEERRIRRSSMRILPNFGGVAGADALCRIEFGPGYRGLITDGVRRVASVTANQGDGQLDWVLKPYTRYVNESNALVWTTDAAALLGVTNGTHQALLAPVSGDDGWGAWGGFSNNWTSNPSSCSGWTSSSSSGTGASIIVSATAANLFPNDNTASPCSATRRLVCVQ